MCLVFQALPGKFLVIQIAPSSRVFFSLTPSSFQLNLNQLFSRDSEIFVSHLSSYTQSCLTSSSPLTLPAASIPIYSPALPNHLVNFTTHHYKPTTSTITTMFSATRTLRQAAVHTERTPLIRFLGPRSIPCKFLLYPTVPRQPLSPMTHVAFSWLTQFLSS